MLQSNRTQYEHTVVEVANEFLLAFNHTVTGLALGKQLKVNCRLRS